MNVLDMLRKQIPDHKFSVKAALYIDGEDSTVCWSTENEDELIRMHGDEGKAALFSAILSQAKFYIRRMEHPDETWQESSEKARACA
jgi:hypothetical protein